MRPGGNICQMSEWIFRTAATLKYVSHSPFNYSPSLAFRFQKLNIPLDLGLNYKSTQAGTNIFDVAVSTQLFNNRVVVNGTVGNRETLGGVSTNEVAGDVDIEIKL